MSTVVVEEEYMNIFNELEELLLNSPKCQDHEDQILIRKAFRFAYNAHDGLKRKSGEPFIIHPIEVAKIVGIEFKMDPVSIVSSLLHDVIEDTDYNYEDIEKEYGTEIAKLVDGLTKTELLYDATSNLQAENFKKLISFMLDDVRVVLIKLADRLHNMRTLDSLSDNRKLEKAGEVIYIFAPLAHRLGIHKIKCELEDLSFKYRHRPDYDQIVKDIEVGKPVRDEIFKQVSTKIDKLLQSENFEYEIVNNTRSVYSTWHQIQTKGISLDNVPNFHTIKIIFKHKDEYLDETGNCFHIYSLLNKEFQIDDNIKNFIQKPRSNGYRALHLKLLVGNIWLSVHILTKEMNLIAEYGYSIYPEFKDNTNTSLDTWLRSVSKTMENPHSNASELLDDIKLELYNSDIFILTPKGQIKVLPEGSTILDFAYEVHSDLGNKCIGGEIDHKIYKINHQLVSGQQVKIITLETVKPELNWLKFVKTAKARNSIKSYFRLLNIGSINKGKELLEKAAKDLNVISEADLSNRLKEAYPYQFIDELYYKVGNGEINERDIKIVFSEKLKTTDISYTVPIFSRFMKAIGFKKTKETPVLKRHESLKLDENIDYKRFNFSINCCNPINGEPAIGFQTADGVIQIHRSDCPEAIRLSSNSNYTIVNVQWESGTRKAFLVRLELKGKDRPKLLRDITNIISSKELNIKDVYTSVNDDVFSGFIDVYVYSIEELNEIRNELRSLKNMESVKRILAQKPLKLITDEE